MKYVVFAVSVAVAAMRFAQPTHALSPSGTYEAFAHLSVGVLIGAGIDKDRRWCWWAAGALSAVEVLAFVLSRMQV